jgi:hypothetical protein
MMPIDFPGTNLTLKKPENMTDEQCMEIKAFRGVDVDGFPFILTMWQPSKEDIDAIVIGTPIAVKVMSSGFAPMAIFTVNDKGEANV